MRTTPQIQEALRQRLAEAADLFFKGSKEKLGKALGWDNGGYVRNCFAKDEKKRRNVTPEFAARANESSDKRLHGWFDGYFPVVTQLDAARADTRKAAKEAWPFTRITPDEWQALTPELQAIIEDAAVVKYRELLSDPTLTAPGVKGNSRKRA